MKLATDIHHVSGNCWKGCQGQRSKVKVIYVEICQRHDGEERKISTVWRQGSLAW